MLHNTRSRTIAGILAGAVGAAITVIGLQALTAQAVDTEESTFVPATPCRLFDTRPGTNVGPKSSPLGPAEEYTLQVTGTVGDCSIPAAATAIAINLTGVEASAPTFVAMYPAGVANPGTSVLNLVSGQTATPNEVEVVLSADGRVTVFNAFGSVHLIGDVMGYYRQDGLADLAERLEALETENAALRSDVTALQTLTASMSLTTVNDRPALRFSGINVQVVDGTDNTACSMPGLDDCNGLGNVVIGYHENYRDVPDEGPGNVRTGSHNLVIGRYHDYSSWSGFVTGDSNSLEGYGASVTGGAGNTAGERASVTGGIANTASGDAATVTGGVRNLADGSVASVTGGSDNSAGGQSASVTGGSDNSASGNYSTVTGGLLNDAAGTLEVVVGGDGLVCDDLDQFGGVVCGEGTVAPETP